MGLHIMLDAPRQWWHQRGHGGICPPVGGWALPALVRGKLPFSANFWIFPPQNRILPPPKKKIPGAATAPGAPHPAQDSLYGKNNFQFWDNTRARSVGYRIVRVTFEYRSSLFYQSIICTVHMMHTELYSRTENNSLLYLQKNRIILI